MHDNIACSKNKQRKVLLSTDIVQDESLCVTEMGTVLISEFNKKALKI